MATAGNDHARTRRGEVGDDLLVVVEHLRADGDAQLDVGAVRAVLAAPPPRLAAAALEGPLRAERGEVAEIRVGEQHDIAPTPTVAAVGPALRHVFLAPKAETAVTAAARDHLDARPVVEHAPTLPASEERERDAVEQADAVDEDLVWATVHLHEVAGVAVGDLARDSAGKLEVDHVEAETLEVRHLDHALRLAHRLDEVESTGPQLRVLVFERDDVDVDVRLLVRSACRERTAEERRDHERIGLARCAESRDCGPARIDRHAPKIVARGARGY
jgi:hypothetical protein